MRTFDEIFNVERMNNALNNIIDKLNQMRNITGSECMRMEEFNKKLSVVSCKFEENGEEFNYIDFNSNETEKNPYNEYWEARMCERINTSSMHNNEPDYFSHETTRLITVAKGFYHDYYQYCIESNEKPESLLSFVKYNKTPYGNKNITASICFNLGWGYIQNEYLPKFVENECWKLHNAVIDRLGKM